MDPNRYIASKIALAREMSGMSIATLARRAGMTPNALSESLSCNLLVDSGIQGLAADMLCPDTHLPTPAD